MILKEKVQNDFFTQPTHTHTTQLFPMILFPLQKTEEKMPSNPELFFFFFFLLTAPTQPKSSWARD